MPAPREVLVGVLVEGIARNAFVYPLIPRSETARMLSWAGWRWRPGVGVWLGQGEPPVPFTRRRAA